MNSSSNVEDIVLVIDISGSMRNKDYPPNRLEAAKQAASEFVHQKFGVDERDSVAVVSFGSQGQTHCEMTNVGTARDKLLKTIEHLQVKGGTAMGRGLEEAGKILSHSTALVQRIVLLSDGYHNTGKSPRPIAKELKSNGVIIDTIGIGGKGAVDEKTLCAVASTVDGKVRYRYIDSSRELVTYFSGLSAKVMPPAFEHFVSTPPAKSPSDSPKPVAPPIQVKVTSAPEKPAQNRVRVLSADEGSAEAEKPPLRIKVSEPD
jgi:uncharacterized protein YegL